MGLAQRKLCDLQYCFLSICEPFLKHDISYRYFMDFISKFSVVNFDKTKIMFDSGKMSADSMLLNVFSTVCTMFLKSYHYRQIPVEMDAEFWLKYVHLKGWKESEPLLERAGDGKSARDVRSEKSIVGIDDRPKNRALNDLFYRAIDLFHVASSSTLQSLARCSEMQRSLNSQLKAVELTRSNWERGPGRALMEQRLSDLRLDLQNLKSLKESITCVLFDLRFMVTPFFSLYEKLCALLLHTSAETMASFPEFVVSDFATFLSFLLQNKTIMCAKDHAVLARFLCAMCKDSSELNIHLKSSLCKCLCTMPDYMYECVENDVVECVVSVFVLVEQRGFVEKIQLRRCVLDLFLRDLPQLERRCKTLWNERDSLFQKFLYIILNDLEQLLDECFTKLNQIALIEGQMETEEWMNQLPDVKRAKEKVKKKKREQRKFFFDFVLKRSLRNV